MKKNKVSNPSPEHDAPTVRERTMAHMKNLLRSSTTLGAGIALVCGVAGQGCKHLVLDPPPPPPPGACVNPDTLRLDYCVRYSARWEKSGLKWTIDLNARVEWGIDNMDFEGLTSADVHASGASVKSIKMEHQKLEIVLTPAKKATVAELSLFVRFNQKQLPFRVKLDLSKPRKRKGYILAELIK
jgi:hypothetical protein